jgi:U4/U6.U5 tri-snRNP-associated protein 2
MSNGLKRKLGPGIEKEVKVKLEGDEPQPRERGENGATTVKTEGDDDVEMSEPRQRGGIVCPYLDTIERKVLDFDFEKLCSVSLASLNVYACLVCGKYFQGRGKTTHAYVHSLEADHHVFINLETEKIYCLPDGYEVIDTSLADIQYNLHPRFNLAKVLQFDSNTLYTHALDGTDYLPGVVGLNNTKSTDWLNVVVQALSRVPIIRNHYIAATDYKANLPDGSPKNEMSRRFGELLCKMWNAENFKGHVSPHEILQAVSAESGKRFKIGTQSDPLKFLSWFLHTLNRLHGGKKGKKTSSISRAFEGELTIMTERYEDGQDVKTTTETKPFFLLILGPSPCTSV